MREFVPNAINNQTGERIELTGWHNHDGSTVEYVTEHGGYWEARRIAPELVTRYETETAHRGCAFDGCILATPEIPDRTGPDGCRGCGEDDCQGDCGPNAPTPCAVCGTIEVPRNSAGLCRACVPATPISALRVGDRVRRTCQPWQGSPNGVVVSIDLAYVHPYAVVRFDDDSDDQGWSGSELAWARL